jgi:hypothetical protein
LVVGTSSGGTLRSAIFWWKKEKKQTNETSKQTGVVFFFFYLLFVSSVGMLEVFVSSEGSQSRFVEDRCFFSSSYVSGIGR